MVAEQVAGPARSPEIAPSLSIPSCKTMEAEMLAQMEADEHFIPTLIANVPAPGEDVAVSVLTQLICKALVTG